MALRATVDFPDAEGLGGAFEVHRVELSDAVSELYEAHLTLFSPDGSLEPRGLIGRRVSLQLGSEALLPAVHGIVRQARRHTVEATGTTSYELTLVPPHWLLTRSRSTRIFQGRTAAQIAEDVLSGDRQSSVVKPSLPAPEQRLRKLPVHDYRVQYDETDHGFLFRVLSEEGIASFFDHATGAWVLCDDTGGGALSLAESIPFDPSNLTPGGPAVLRWCEIADVETGAVARRDFDFEKPLFKLEALAPAPGMTLAENEASPEDYGDAAGECAVGGGGRAAAPAPREPHSLDRRQCAFVGSRPPCLHAAAMAAGSSTIRVMRKPECCSPRPSRSPSRWRSPSPTPSRNSMPTPPSVPKCPASRS